MKINDETRTLTEFYSLVLFRSHNLNSIREACLPLALAMPHAASSCWRRYCFEFGLDVSHLFSYQRFGKRVFRIGKKSGGYARSWGSHPACRHSFFTQLTQSVTDIIPLSTGKNPRINLHTRIVSDVVDLPGRLLTSQSWMDHRGLLSLLVVRT